MRSGPRLALLVGRRKASNVARALTRPTPPGVIASYRKAVTPLEPPRSENGSAAPSRHALTKTVGSRPLAGVGLVRSLHVVLPFTAARTPPCPLREKKLKSLRPRPGAEVGPPIVGEIRPFPLVGRADTVYVRSTMAWSRVPHLWTRLWIVEGPAMGRSR